ncbi:MAG TPA: type 1 glutamine amidotransferase domain-containing protein [Planctomycetota bacterium]
MKALILTANEVEDLEFLYPFYRLIEEGFEVHVATGDGEKLTGKHGYTHEPDLSFAEVDSQQYDMLILPGGKAPESVRLNKDALSVVNQMVNDGKLIAAICHGPQILISAGKVKGKRATCWWGVRDDLIAAGANWVDEEVVVDGNLITSRCPQDLPAFCRAILKAVAVEAK